MSTRHGTSRSARRRSELDRGGSMAAMTAGSTGPARPTTSASPTSERRLLAERSLSPTTSAGSRAGRAACTSRGRRGWRSSAPTGCWSSGCWPPASRCWRSIPTRSRPPAIASGRRRQVRPLRRVRALAELARTDAHRFRALVPDSDETKALRALTRAPRGPGRRAGRARQPAARPARRLLARRRADLRRPRHRRSRWPSSSATRAPPTPAASGPGAWPPSSRATRY